MSAPWLDEAGEGQRGMGSRVHNKGERWLAVAFAAYAFVSLGYASAATAMTMSYVGQAAVYAVAAGLLLRSQRWAGWFALGTAISGVLTDVVALAVLPGLDSYCLVDTLMQTGLLFLVLRHVRPQLAATGIATRIGWTFALGAGAMNPLVMYGLAPKLLRTGGCYHAITVWSNQPREIAGAVLLPVLAFVALRLIARLRTTGLLLMAATVVLGAVALAPTLFQLVTISHAYMFFRLDRVLGLVGLAFLTAALLPLAGPALAHLRKRD